MKTFETKTEVIFNREVAPDTFFMALRAPEIADCSKPGQFVMVKVSKGLTPLLRRPFSICGRIGSDQILILYRVVGSGTALMSKIKKGEILSVLGPLGRGFDIPENVRPVLVGGGMGIAPLIFLSQNIKHNSFAFMAGFGSVGEIITPKDLIDSVIDISVSTDDGTAGYSGFVTDMFHEYLDKNIQEDKPLSIFTCGPGIMMKKVAELAIEHNIQCQTSLEAIMACGLGACQGCAVKTSSRETQEYYHVCKDGPVFPADVIDWSSI